MMQRIVAVGFNTFRETIRDRVLYNLIAFAILLSATSLLFGSISIGVEKIILVNLSLTAVSVFGVIIAVFFGMGLVSKDIEKRSLYTVLSRPTRRWELLVGKFLGLSGMLLTNTFLMAIGIFSALWILVRHLDRNDFNIAIALWMIVLQLFIVTAVAMLFSSFTTPVLTAIFSFVVFVMGNFESDLWAYANAATGFEKMLARAAGTIIPDLSNLNVIAQAAHGDHIAVRTVVLATSYTAIYIVAVLAMASAIFARKNLK